jgi:hypothetical protein
MHIENEMEMVEVAFNILIRYMIELLFPHDPLALAIEFCTFMTLKL